MTRRWSRFLPLLITALWLPLQTVAAVAMPFCRHAAEQVVVVEAMTQEAHCPGHAAELAAQAATPATSDCAQDCDGCGFCHLASAGYMPPMALTAASLPAARDFTAHAVLTSPSFIPDPPQHPPRRLS